MEDILETYFLTLIVMLVVMLLLREFFCWYWKINEMKKLMQEQKNILSNIEISSAQSKKFLKILAEKENATLEKKRKSSNANKDNYPNDHPLKKKINN